MQEKQKKGIALKSDIKGNPEIHVHRRTFMAYMETIPDEWFVLVGLERFEPTKNGTTHDLFLRQRQRFHRNIKIDGPQEVKG